MKIARDHSKHFSFFIRVSTHLLQWDFSKLSFSLMRVSQHKKRVREKLAQHKNWEKLDEWKNVFPMKAENSVFSCIRTFSVREKLARKEQKKKNEINFKRKEKKENCSKLLLHKKFGFVVRETIQFLSLRARYLTMD